MEGSRGALRESGHDVKVASATATFVMMFSSSLSVVEFYFLHRFPLPYAGYLIFISILAGFWGQCLVQKIVHLLKRASLIVFILSSVIFASALTMGVSIKEEVSDAQPFALSTEIPAPQGSDVRKNTPASTPVSHHPNTRSLQGEKERTPHRTRVRKPLFKAHSIAGSETVP